MGGGCWNNMNLAIDIGNTHIKLGLFQGDKLEEVVLLKKSLEQTLSRTKIEHAILAKTGDNDEIERWLKNKNIPTLVLSHQLKLPIEILYKTPQTLGADRIAGSV